MRLRRPSHTTAVAYVALFGALGTGVTYAAEKIGTADLKRDAVTARKIKDHSVRAGEVKEPIVRVFTKQATMSAAYSVEARCKRNERFLSGGGGWVEAGTIRFSAPLTDQRAPAPPGDYAVYGTPTQIPNELEARVVCLPR